MPVPVPAYREPWSNVILSLFGIVLAGLIFVGLLSYHAIFLIPPPGSSAGTDPATIAYINTLRILGWSFAVAMDLAVALSVGFAWIIGVSKMDVGDGTRRGVYIFATVFLVVWLFVSALPLQFIRFR